MPAVRCFRSFLPLGQLIYYKLLLGWPCRPGKTLQTTRTPHNTTDQPSARKFHAAEACVLGGNTVWFLTTENPSPYVAQYHVYSRSKNKNKQQSRCKGGFETCTKYHNAGTVVPGMCYSARLRGRFFGKPNGTVGTYCTKVVQVDDPKGWWTPIRKPRLNESSTTSSR